MRVATGHGFTLLELLVVIMLLAAVTAVVGPAYSRWQKSDIRFHAARIKTELRYLRSQAVLQAGPAEFAFDVGNRSYATSAGKRMVMMPQDVTVSFTLDRDNVSSGVGRIYFYPDGTSSGGVIELGQGAKRIRLVVSWLSGKIEIL